MFRRLCALLLFYFGLCPAHADMCIDLFKRAPPQFPGSVYVKVPENKVLTSANGLSIESTQSLFDQLSLEVKAVLPLPAGLGPKSHQIEVDVSFEDLHVAGGQIVGRMGTSLKDALPTQNQTTKPPVDVRNPLVNANSMLAMHVDMINAAVAHSLPDIAANPWNYSYGRLDIQIKSPPKLIGVSSLTRHYSNLEIELDTTVPRNSILMSGLPFKEDIKARIRLKAEFVVAGNSISLKVSGLAKDGFQLDTSTLRWGVNKSAMSFLSSKMAGLLSLSMRHNPIIFANLLTLPQQVAGFKTDLAHVMLDTDGYLKIQLDVEPLISGPTNISVRVKDR